MQSGIGRNIVGKQGAICRPKKSNPAPAIAKRSVDAGGRVSTRRAGRFRGLFFLFFLFFEGSL